MLPLIEKTIDKENPRIWYYALMDFGVFLKKNYPNPSRASAHHQKQSTFEGSQRQLRANILRFCLDYKGNSLKSDVLFLFRDERTAKVLQALSDEGFLHSSLLLS